MLFGALAMALIASSCSAPERETAPSEAAGQDAETGCMLGATRIVDRFQAFIDDLPDASPEEFLAQEEVVGLTTFQDDVAVVIAETTDQRSTLCNLDGLQDQIAEQLANVEREGVLEEFLVATVLRGGQLERADITVAPDDDLENLLGLLDDGSTITLTAGTFNLTRPLIVQRDISFLGQGVAETTLRSSLRDAVVVVLGRGKLTTRDLSLEHQGVEPASVVVAFGRPVDIGATALGGGVTDDEGVGGNGLVLTDQLFGGGGSAAPDVPPSVVTTPSTSLRSAQQPATAPARPAALC